jgi:hypothetical protein
VPLATLRHKPARIISLWLVASASAGISFTVGISIRLYLISNSFCSYKPRVAVLKNSRHVNIGQVYSPKDLALQAYFTTLKIPNPLCTNFRVILLAILMHGL